MPVLIPCSAHEREGFATFSVELAAAQPVRALSDADTRAALRRMQHYELEHLNATLAAIQAIHTKDSIALKKAAKRFDTAAQMKKGEHDRQSPSLMPERWVTSDWGRWVTMVFGLKSGQELDALLRYGGYKSGPHAQREIKWRLSLEMSKAVEDVRFVLWWTGERFLPALYCADLKTGLYVKGLLSLIGGKCFRVCPYCDQPFFQTRPDQNYCSIPHREAHRVARWRARQKAMSEKKVRKHGTRKTR